MNDLLGSADAMPRHERDIERLTLAEIVSIVASFKPRRHRALRNSDEARSRIETMARAGLDAAAGIESRTAGVDEAGRGPLAGPVVAAAVVLPTGSDSHLVDSLLGINDSKRLSPLRRCLLFLEIMRVAEEVSLGIATSAEIDHVNIREATHMAMRRAVGGLKQTPDLALVDGNSDPGLPCPTQCIVKGDARVLSISAASIVAKVARDVIMDSLHSMYPQYGFDSNKGYPTKAHYQALEEYGPCPVHRKTFRLSSSA